MYPPIFSTCAADIGVQAELGTSPTRLYPFGDAPAGVTKPYAVWQIITGLPENCLSGVPDIDRYTVQVDCYSDTASGARQAAKALRDAIEPYAHIVAWRGESRDPETRNYRVSFDVDWFVHRDEIDSVGGGVDSVGDSIGDSNLLNNLLTEGDAGANILVLSGDLGGNELGI